MKTSTITEEGADLIFRGLKLVEADIIKFRTGAEGRGYKHTVDECNAQLQALRGNGAEPGLFSQFAPQIDAFEAGSLNGDGSAEEGQLALGGAGDDGNAVRADDDAGTVTDDDVPVNSELEQGGATVFGNSGVLDDKWTRQSAASEELPILHRPGRSAKRQPGAKAAPAAAKKKAGRPKGSGKKK